MSAPRPRPGARQYHIAFDTLEMPGKVIGVRVELGTSIIRDDDVVHINLSDDPLYAKLERYVLDNPSRKS